MNKIENRQELITDVVIFAILAAVYLSAMNMAIHLHGLAAVSDWLSRVMEIGVVGLAAAHLLAKSKKSKLKLAIILPGSLGILTAFGGAASDTVSVPFLGIALMACYSFAVWGFFGFLSVAIEPQALSLLRKVQTKS